MIEPGIYQHYKGKLYLVLFVAQMDETHELYVAYVPLYEIPENLALGVQVTLRPLHEFVSRTRDQRLRFRRVSGGG